MKSPGDTPPLTFWAGIQRNSQHQNDNDTGQHWWIETDPALYRLSARAAEQIHKGYYNRCHFKWICCLSQSLWGDNGTKNITNHSLGVYLSMFVSEQGEGPLKCCNHAPSDTTWGTSKRQMFVTDELSDEFVNHQTLQIVMWGRERRVKEVARQIAPTNLIILSLMRVITPKICLHKIRYSTLKQKYQIKFSVMFFFSLLLFLTCDSLSGRLASSDWLRLAFF